MPGVPDAPGVSTEHFSEAPTADLLWQFLDGLARIQDVGRALFSPPLAEQNRYWREFGNYLRQAKAYWDGATGTPGSSAALLYYYAFLNLAKAELLVRNPTAIYEQRVHHGLSYQPTSARSLGGEKVKVVPGAFPMLYEQRTGVPLPTGTVLDVRRLLKQVPEIGKELNETGLGRPLATPLLHTVVGDNAQAWVLLGSVYPAALADSTHVTSRVFHRHFSRVNLLAIPDWRDKFALSRRARPSEMFAWESNQTFTKATGSGTEPDFDAAARHLRDVLGTYVSDAVDLPADVILTSSIMKSRTLPMPASLARYAAMFYVSSLVRYKPSALDPVREAGSAWLMDSFTRLAPLHVLEAALAGIKEHPIAFDRTGFRA